MNSPSEDSSNASRTSSKCITAVRVPLIILNLITWICGGALIGLGIWVVTTDNEYKHFVENKNIFIVYITLAAVLFTAGIFGACGALAGNKLLLYMYFIIICLAFCALLGLVVFGVIQKNLVHELVQKNWNKTSDNTRIFIQEKFDCCGIGDNVTYSHKSNTDKSCFVNETIREEVKQNCFAKLVDWFQEHQVTIASIAASIMLLMILLMVSSCCLLHQLGTSKMEIKRNRVGPIVVNENHGNHTTIFTEERPHEHQRGHSEIENELVTIEEAGQGSYSLRGKEKEKQPRRHENKSWAKKDGIMLQ